MTQQERFAAFAASLDAETAEYTETFPAANPDAVRTHLAFVQAMQTWERSWVSVPDGGVTEGQWTLLRMLFLSPDHRMAQSEIARRIGVSGTYITKLIDAVEAKGYLQRAVNRDDRRVTYAVLTTAGVDFCERVIPQILEAMTRATAALSANQQRTLQDLLIKLCIGLTSPEESASVT